MLHTLDSGNTFMESVFQKKINSSPFFLPLVFTVIILLFWRIPYAAMYLKGEGSGAGIWGIFSIIALVTTLVTPIAYGWITHNTKGTVLLGILPYLFATTVPQFVMRDIPVIDGWLVQRILTIASLCAIGGLGGYFASRHEVRSLVVAVVLAGVWIFVFLSGIN